MAQESPKNSAAEIPVTSNGQLDDSHEHSFNRVRIFLLSAMVQLSEILKLQCSAQQTSLDIVFWRFTEETPLKLIDYCQS